MKISPVVILDVSGHILFFPTHPQIHYMMNKAMIGEVVMYEMMTSSNRVTVF